MNENDLLIITDKLNSISFYNMKKFKMGDVIFYQLKSYTKESLVNMIKNMFAFIIKYTYNIDNKNENSIVFFFGSSYYKRIDHLNKMNKVKELINNSTSVVCRERRNISIKSIMQLWKIFIYYKNLKSLNVDKNLKLFMSCCILNLNFEMKQIVNLINGICPRIVVTFCDCMPIDSMVTKYYKLQGIKTATLQHGHYDNKDSNGKYAFLMSKSDYFLCYGEYTKRIAQKLGLKEEKLIISGPPELINKSLPSKIKINNLKKIGVLLSSSDREKENMFILNVAKNLAEEFGLTYEVRLHPSVDMKCFTEIIDNKFCKGIDNSKGLIDNFCSRQDLFIVGGTSVFIPLVSELKIVFRFVEDESVDMFTGIDCGKFKTLDEAVNLYKDVSLKIDCFEKKLIKTREILISDANINENYINFFSKFNSL